MLVAPPADAPTLPRPRPRAPRCVPAWRAPVLTPVQDAVALDDEPSLLCSWVHTDVGPTPVHFGRYRLLGVVGAGGSSQVFAAHDTLLDQPVAIKRIPAGLTDPDAARTWLAREVRCARRFSHPAVIRVHGLEEHAGEVFLTMEYVPGRPLSMIVAAAPLPPADVLALGCVLADALSHVHAAGVVHCDLKPDNVVIGDNGRVVLVDFGIAQPSGAPARRCGTPGYMSPEQMAGEPVSQRTDVFGLGALLHAASIGPSLVDPSVWRHRRDLHPGLARLLARCLAQDPAHRVPSMAALGAQLDALHRELLPGPPARRWLDASGAW